MSKPSNTNSKPSLVAFRAFQNARGQRKVLQAFHAMCHRAGIFPNLENPYLFYQALRQHYQPLWQADQLFQILDNRRKQSVYRFQTGATRLRTLIVGAGPCGLRMAIEFACLGFPCIVLEKREEFTRQNVLYLWGYVVDDLLKLGAKQFYGKFNTTSIPHISIQTLQCILLKVALLFGVQVFPGVGFTDIKYPTGDKSKQRGWRAQLDKEVEFLSEYEFDILIGADGRRNTMPGFSREAIPCPQAIAMTANFLRTNDEDRLGVEEIAGRAFHFHPEYFSQIESSTGAKLENIVYYRDETNYFIMTAKKESLLKKGVLKGDDCPRKELLNEKNIDRSALQDLLLAVAHHCTNHRLAPRLSFAMNNHSQPDVSIFDFTTLKHCKYSCRVLRRNGQQLFIALIGDSLVEPFWPQGTGCAYGFLHVYDTAWIVRLLASNENSLQSVIHERERIYGMMRNLALTELREDFDTYTIDPSSRYKHYMSKEEISPTAMLHVKKLIDGDDNNANESVGLHFYRSPVASAASHKPSRYTKRGTLLIPSQVPIVHSCPADFEWFVWFYVRLSHYTEVWMRLQDFRECWSDGMGFLYLIHGYKPDEISLESVITMTPFQRLNLALELFKRIFKVTPLLKSEEIMEIQNNQFEVLQQYLIRIYQALATLVPEFDSQPSLLVQTVQESAPKVTAASRRQNFKNGPSIIRASVKRASRKIVPQGLVKKRMQCINESEVPNSPLSLRRVKESNISKSSVSLAVVGMESVGVPTKNTKESVGNVCLYQDKYSILSRHTPDKKNKCRVCEIDVTSLIDRVVLKDGSLLHRKCLICATCRLTLMAHDACPSIDRTSQKFVVFCRTHVPRDEHRPNMKSTLYNSSSNLFEQIKEHTTPKKQLALPALIKPVHRQFSNSVEVLLEDKSPSPLMSSKRSSKRSSSPRLNESVTSINSIMKGERETLNSSSSSLSLDSSFEKMRDITTQEQPSLLPTKMDWEETILCPPPNESSLVEKDKKFKSMTDLNYSDRQSILDPVVLPTLPPELNVSLPSIEHKEITTSTSPHSPKEDMKVSLSSAVINAARRKQFLSSAISPIQLDHKSAISELNKGNAKLMTANTSETLNDGDDFTERSLMPVSVVPSSGEFVPSNKITTNQTPIVHSTVPSSHQKPLLENSLSPSLLSLASTSSSHSQSRFKSANPLRLFQQQPNKLNPTAANENPHRGLKTVKRKIENVVGFFKKGASKSVENLSHLAKPVKGIAENVENATPRIVSPEKDLSSENMTQQQWEKAMHKTLENDVRKSIRTLTRQVKATAILEKTPEERHFAIESSRSAEVGGDYKSISIAIRRLREQEQSLISQKRLELDDALEKVTSRLAVLEACKNDLLSKTVNGESSESALESISCQEMRERKNLQLLRLQIAHNKLHYDQCQVLEELRLIQLTPSEASRKNEESLMCAYVQMMDERETLQTLMDDLSNKPLFHLDGCMEEELCQMAAQSTYSLRRVVPDRWGVSRESRLI